jgi:hypothetical protein
MPAKMYACHYADVRDGRGIPECFLPAETVYAMIEAGQAEWGNPKKMNWVRFRKIKNEIPKTARSLKPGLSVMDGYVMGDTFDVAIIESWRWKYAA